MDKKIGQPKGQPKQKTRLDNTSTEAQRARVLERLQLGPVDTAEMRAELNIMSPAPRIKELRDAGHDIYTERVTLTDDYGRKHERVARYHLVSLAGQSVGGA